MLIYSKAPLNKVWDGEGTVTGPEEISHYGKNKRMAGGSIKITQLYENEIFIWHLFFKSWFKNAPDFACLISSGRSKAKAPWRQNP